MRTALRGMAHALATWTAVTWFAQPGLVDARWCTHEGHSGGAGWNLITPQACTEHTAVECFDRSWRSPQEHNDAPIEPFIA